MNSGGKGRPEVLEDKSEAGQKLGRGDDSLEGRAVA